MERLAYLDNSKSWLSGDLWGPAVSDIWMNPHRYWIDAHFSWPSDSYFATANGWVVDESEATVALTCPATVQGGRMLLSITGTDNVEGFVNREIPQFCINAGLGKLWYEASIIVGGVADNEGAIAVGLSEPLAAGDNVYQVDDTGALAQIDFVGFQTLQASADEIDTIYGTNGGAAVQAQDNVATLAASTAIKLGMFFDGIKTISYWINGVKCSTTVLESATSFPDGELLGLAFALKVGSDAAASLGVNWACCVQERVS